MFLSFCFLRQKAVEVRQICAAHSAPAGDLLPLHQARSCCDVTLQSRDRLLTPQCHSLHTGHMFPLLQVDPCREKTTKFYMAVLHTRVSNNDPDQINDRGLQEDDLPFLTAPSDRPSMTTLCII